MTALFAALACVATMSIRIPTPGTGGYIHPGDAIVILAGIILGPVYGMLAGGIGSALSDLIGGYFVKRVRCHHATFTDSICILHTFRSHW